MPDSTNRSKPTGGVICAISTTNTMKMPNQIRSMPAACTVGSNTPMVSTTIEMPSRKQPSTMKNTINAMIRPNCDRPNPPIHSASARGRPI
ncbi:hypothetical protein G6F57_023693 [Rhizopus arrhizus]|nr:hypothetical protein G6F57_023693 [Rhizopus arrhizus]